MKLPTPWPSYFRGPFIVANCVFVCLFSAASQPAPMAIKGRELLTEDFQRYAQHTKDKQPVKDGWTVRAGHAEWKRTTKGVQSIWTSGHMPVLVYEGSFSNAIIEVDFRFQRTDDKWAGCRISASHPELNPRAYAVSVWANLDSKARQPGMVLEHDEWNPGEITTVRNAPATFEPGKWYTLRLETIGNAALASCNGVTVYGTHEKFGLPKKLISLGVGLCPHELRNLRVYEALPNPAWSPAAAGHKSEKNIPVGGRK